MIYDVVKLMLFCFISCGKGMNAKMALTMVRLPRRAWVGVRCVRSRGKSFPSLRSLPQKHTQRPQKTNSKYKPASLHPRSLQPTPASSSLPGPTAATTPASAPRTEVSAFAPVLSGRDAQTDPSLPRPCDLGLAPVIRLRLPRRPTAAYLRVGSRPIPACFAGTFMPPSV